MPRVNLGQHLEFRPPEPTPNREDDEYIGQHNPRPILVHRNHDVDHVLQNVQQNKFGGQNNIGNMVEQTLAQNGLNVGLHRPNFTSLLLEYIRTTKLPRGWIVPKFTKFAGDTSESTVKHLARYQTEAGDMENNENLKMNYFLNSLSKNDFTWFTILSLYAIQAWC